jgi:hypothetical protein
MAGLSCAIAAPEQKTEAAAAHARIVRDTILVS